jgi:hypothetical protein
MQDCCKTAPRRARYVVIALVVAGAIAAGLLGTGGEGQATATTQAGAAR